MLVSLSLRFLKRNARLVRSRSVEQGLRVDLLINFGILTVSLVLLFFGAEWLVKGSSEIALKVGISPLVVGLTIVAFGTSAPELLVSLKANMKTPPEGGLALGNVIGSNICNIGLVLGLTALLKPLIVHKQVVKRDMPLLVIISIVFLFFLRDGAVQRWEGAVFAVGVVLYTGISLILSKMSDEGSEEISEEEAEEARKAGAGKMAMNVLLVLVGFVFLKFGADYLVSSGSEIAVAFGVPAAIIGLTVVAFGTSVPELATSVAAVRKGEVDIIMGNAIGSCVFNLLAVVGITAAVSQIDAPDVKSLDLAVMMGITLAVTVLGIIGFKLNRWQGGLLLVTYLIYTVATATMG